MLLNVLRHCSVRCKPTPCSIGSRLPFRTFSSFIARPATKSAPLSSHVTRDLRLPASRILPRLNISRLHTSTKTEQASSATSEPADPPLPILPSPAVGGWLMFSSVLVFAVIVVGGVTRLTESGLSITEWKPIAGVLPPLSQDEWMVEFNKYKETPEFKLYVFQLYDSCVY